MPLIEEIQIGNSKLSVKNYHCIECDDNFIPCKESDYYTKGKPGIRLYVHVTDYCNGNCPFCRRKDEPQKDSEVNPIIFEKYLRQISPFVASVDITGGEPMLFPGLTDELIGIADQILSPETEIDLVTNGTNFHYLPEMGNAARLTSVHLSRHMINDSDNQKLMGYKTPSSEEIVKVIQRLNDPGKVVLNCVLQEDGVASEADIADYLDFSIRLGVRNNSFIGMFRSTAFCREHYVSPWEMPFLTDNGCKKWNNEHPEQQFAIWNRHADHDFCRCLTGSYHNSYGRTRFYFRCPGDAIRPEYCRQLVYTSDNRVVAGFAQDSIVLLHE